MKRHQIGFRVRDVMLADLFDAAQRNGRSISEEVEARLENYATIIAVARRA